MVDAVRIGSIAMAHHDFASLDRFEPDIGVFNAPFMYRDPEHAMRATAPSSPVLEEINAKLVEQGNVRSVKIAGHKVTGQMEDGRNFQTYVPDDPNFVQDLRRMGVSISAEPPTDDVRVRQALMYALDREQMIETVLVGAATLATGNLAPTLEEWYEPDVQQYEYDPDRAIELLEEAGWEEGDDGVRERDGERLEWECLVFVGDEVRRPQAEMATEYWRAIGAEGGIREVSAASAEMREGTGDMALHNWTYGGGQGEPDARATLQTGGGNNFTHFSNEQMDELLEQGVAEVDPAARREIYSEVQKLFAEQVPTLFMMHWDWFNHFNERIQGLPDEVQSGSNLYRRIRDFWIEE
jgi:ABC-type transport system substrate-binding protein